MQTTQCAATGTGHRGLFYDTTSVEFSKIPPLVVITCTGSDVSVIHSEWVMDVSHDSLDKSMARKVWIIMADQLSHKFLGHAGYHPWIQTPNLDNLAKKSLVFQRAYCSSPLCVPARMSFYTGRNTRYHKCVCDYKTLHQPTLFHHLKEAGIPSYAVGKIDFRFDQDQYHGITERPGIEAGAQDVFPGVNNFSSFIGRTVTTIEREEDEQCEAITRTSLECLERPGPSLIYTSYLKPHDSWDNDIWYDAPRKFFNLYHGLPGRLMGYAANVSLLDEHVGKCLTMAEERGLLKDTMVIFTSDHGEMAGEYDLWGKQCLFEGAIRVPLIVWMGGKVWGHPSSLAASIDVFPSVFRFLGLACPPTDGVSLFAKNRQDRHVFVEVFDGRFWKRRYRDWDNKLISYDDGVSRLKRCVLKSGWKLVHDGEKPLLYSTKDFMEDLTDYSDLRPKTLDHLGELLETLYPVEGILSRWEFPRKQKGIF
jgi:arylsulfatase A-like enzyme